MITFKQKEFVRFYTDQNNPETYLNSFQSALAAKYEKGTAYAASRKILNKKEVKEEIERVQEDKKQLGAIALEEKKSIAWENYLESKKSGNSEQARKWFREHGELSGHYIAKSEVNQKVAVQQLTDEENKLINEAIRKNRLAGVN